MGQSLADAVGWILFIGIALLGTACCFLTAARVHKRLLARGTRPALAAWGAMLAGQLALLGPWLFFVPSLVRVARRRN